ncbi:MAG: TonB-dependent receptor, partial [Bacteroidales bacterium]|nr:TonB-dependent receptor [Bacteroidales bacterium]
NKFAAVYDNMTLMSLGAEVSWRQSEKLQFLLKGSYNTYELDSLAHPWHLPATQISLSSDYNLRNKILLAADIFYTGKRYATGVSDNVIELKGYLDANLSIEYRYTKALSFFVRFNNLTASRYEIWNQYPTQRFQFLAGFSYAL